MENAKPYRGRLAPSPTGYLHLGHARTFWIAQQRCAAQQGALILRNEDLDAGRCRPEFVQAMGEDLRWFGFVWQEGPDIGGPFGPYAQSERMRFYREAFQCLVSQGAVYPCSCSRQDVLRALSAPHAGDEEPLYPGVCRPSAPLTAEALRERAAQMLARTGRVSWRFLAPSNQAVSFVDGRLGPSSYLPGRDFGDFIVWRHDDLPSYQLAVTVDDASMQITEVVRGADLLLSTARQLLLYRAFGWPAPSFYHCPLMLDERGQRLAKRHDALSLRQLRLAGKRPEEIIREWNLS